MNRVSDRVPRCVHASRRRRQPPSRQHRALALLAATLVCRGLSAADKNGVAPQAISLPSGPGSIQGLGGSFQPQLNSGTGTYGVPLLLPRGPGGLTPSLELSYNTGSGNGALGLGWSLSAAVSVRRSMDHGVPRYVDGPNGLDDDFDGREDNPEEVDELTGANGEELVPLADGSYRAENEGAFVRYARSGAGWEGRAPDGTVLLFGITAQARVEDGSRTLEWCLERRIDRHGNAIDFEYIADPVAPAHKYLRALRWGQPGAYFKALLHYESGRPDVTVSYLPGFELRTSLRLASVDVLSQGIPAPAFAERADFDGDGRQDALIRRYRIEYDATSHLSLLSRVTLLGADGATALPSIEFGYSRWTPPDNVSAAVIRSRGAPVEGFDSGSTELIDMNGDGLPDLLTTSGSQHRVSPNQGIDAEGRLAWGPPRPVTSAPSIDLASERTHLADVTSDGISDLLVKASHTSLIYFENLGRNAWSPAPLSLRNTDTWPIWPFEGESGSLSRSIDVDYSRSNDVLYITDTGMQLWLLLPGARYGRELRLPPPICEGKVFRFDLPGTRVADVNGDRLQDLAWIQASRVVYFPSLGRGAFGAPVFLPLGRTLSSAEVDRADFSDVDGDGLVDLTLVRPESEPGGVVYWLNRFDRGLEAARTVRGLPALKLGDELRWADMNGNGTTDIVISQGQSEPGEKILVVDLAPEGKAHLLVSVQNGLGLTTRLEYESSSAQMVRAEAGGIPWGRTMPIVTAVVSRLSEEDGLGGLYEQRITYRDPRFDGAKQEFRGFATAEAYEPGDSTIAGKRTRQTYDTGAVSPCWKGKLLGEEIRAGDGALHQRTVKTWGRRVVAVGVDQREVCFAFESATDQFLQEGGAATVQIREETDYDDLGNAIAERKLGDVARYGDEIVIERTFEPRLEPWLLRLATTAVRLDGSGRRLDGQRYFYDERGDLVRSESWLDTGDRWIPVLRQVLDGFGNVVEAQDGRGHRRLVAFDDLLHAWPVRETMPLESRNLEMSAAYDLGWGLVASAVDFHGQRTSYAYDPLGRLVEQSRPGGAGELYEYRPGNPVSRVTKRLRIDGNGGTFDSHAYTDGHGRPLGTKIASEGGSWRVVDARSYNARKLAAASWLPYSSDTPEYSPPNPELPHEAHFYDAQGRSVETRKPDGSANRWVYRPLEVDVFDGNDTAGDRAPDIRRMDGLGRMISVEERNGDESYVTRYAWTPQGQLETIVDSLGNVRRFRFDSLGRLVESNDPDRGQRRYEYDDNGNLVQREDAKGNVIRFELDAANRILSKDYVGLPRGGEDVLDCVYHYDSPAGELDFGDGTRGSARHLDGRLAWIEDASGEEHFSYDERGNVEWVLKRLRDSATGVVVAYRTQRIHDLLNREAEVIFPDNDRCRYLRGAGGFVERVDGGPEGRVILGAAEHAPNGQPLRFELGNGVRTTLEYDSSQRLFTLRTVDVSGKEILHDSIEYDAASNVVSIVDGRPLDSALASSQGNRTARFTYDGLNRLTRAAYGTDAALGSIDYVLDPLGNILRQSTQAPQDPDTRFDAAADLGELSYDGGRSGRDGRGPAGAPGPHAVTRTGSGRGFSYDPNGNLEAIDAAILKWDREDRLVGFEKAGVVAEYVRDHAGRRVLKRVVRGAARAETCYVGVDFEVEEGSPAKYVDVDGRRLARVDGFLDPTREAVQRLVLAEGWNLFAAAVTSTASLREALGDDASVYEARGASYAPVDTSVAIPFGKALWVHVPSARLAVLRGPIPAAVDSESAGPLHAWPRLESFQPDTHGEAGQRLWLFDARAHAWRVHDPSLPGFLGSVPGSMGAAAVFWAPRKVGLHPSIAAAMSVVHFHTDHLGSPAALTSATGQLVEERTCFPYGALRSRRRSEDAGNGSGEADARRGFTGKELDRESGLVEMGARSYLDIAGLFLSPDPRFAEAPGLAAGSEADQASFAAFLANPQSGNLYAYGARNPLKLVDPDGLEVTYSKVLEGSPVFQEALALFNSTEEGQRIIAHIEKTGARVTLSAGRVFGTDPASGRFGELLGQTTLRSDTQNARVVFNLTLHKKNHPTHDDLILELADTIHHELRHVEGNINRSELAIARRNLDALGDAARIMNLPRQPLNPILRMGNEVHNGLDVTRDDPYNATFRTQAQWEQTKINVRKISPLIETDLD